MSHFLGAKHFYNTAKQYVPKAVEQMSSEREPDHDEDEELHDLHLWLSDDEDDDAEDIRLHLGENPDPDFKRGVAATLRMFR